MQFGKTIQSQQVPGWGEYYLNYKVRWAALPFVIMCDTYELRLTFRR